MACTQPLKAWKYGTHPSGKQKLVFKDPQVEGIESQEVACGKCESCRIDYSRDWATRVFHEMQVSKVGCFLTLTIDNKHMVKKGFYRQENGEPKYYPPYSVYKRSLQLFFKKLRKATAIKKGRKLIYQEYRYLACGEYGDKYFRPHYHAVIMGYDFPDKKYWQMSPSGELLYRSSLLEKVWPYGFSSIGEANWKTAAYIARYTLKKRKDKGAYQRIDKETGEWTEVNPEFVIMSKGIGKTWWQKYKTDTDKDYLIVDRDKTTRVPRYYDKLREREDPESLADIKKEREEYAIANQEGAERKVARSIVKKTQAAMLKRGYDNAKENL
jgi:hypothetical protein